MFPHFSSAIATPSRKSNLFHCLANTVGGRLLISFTLTKTGSELTGGAGLRTIEASAYRAQVGLLFVRSAGGVGTLFHPPLLHRSCTLLSCQTWGERKAVVQQIQKS